MPRLKTPSLLFALLMALPFAVHAQFYNGMNMEFGKNRVQWRDFHWSYYRYETFDVYYYQGGVELANHVLNFAKEEIPAMEKLFGAHFGKKVQFLVFNSLGDLKQSNLNNDEENTGNTGGVTKLIGSKVLLYFNGSYADFDQQIRNGIAKLLLTQSLNGVSIGSQIRNSYRYDIPEWFQNGLCAYITEDWDSYKEDRLQCGILSGDFKRLNHLSGDDAIIAGYSFWQFIEERYGGKALNDIITLAESSQNVKKSLLYVTGVKYKELLRQWYGFYEQRYGTLRLNAPSETMPMPYRRYRVFTQPQVSPDGKYLAYATNDEGKIAVWVEESHTGKRERLYKTGFKSDTWVDTSFPLIAWHPSGGILSFIVEEEGKLQLCNLDMGTRKLGKTYLFEFQTITSFSYAHRDRKIVLAATRFGKPDIFVYDLFSNTIEQLTDDDCTDLSPVFTSDDRQVVFSSNREGGRQFNLYSCDYADSEHLLRNLTRQQVSNSIKPKSFAGNKLFYLNDSSGYYNLNEVLFDSAVSHIDTIVHYRYFATSRPLTGYTASIVDYTYNPRERKLVMVTNDAKGQRFHSTPYPTTQNPPNSQLNPFAQKRLLKKKKAETATLAKTTIHRFKNSYRVHRKKAPYGTTADSANMAAGMVPLDPIEGSETLLVAKKDTTVRPQNYYVELFTDEMISQVDFSYMNYSYQPFTGGGSAIYLNSGFNIFLGTTLADLMEDYKIDIGVKMNNTFVNNEYVVRFRDLSRRVDKSLTLHRYVTDDYATYYHRTFTNEAFYTLSYPFSETLSLRGTGIYRMDRMVNLAIDNYSLADGDVWANLGGLRGELVYDDSKKLQTNIYVGSRGKVFAEYYQTLKRATSNMVVVGFDYRHYTRIHRNFIWANRVAGSSSFGQNKLIYYMGGVDNWILADFNNGTPIDYNRNYLYQTLATNMRGFSQNIRNGNNFVVLNSELRFPMFSYLLDRPINMRFIKDFQVVAFGDVGTAWTGWNPYDTSNSLFTSHYTDGNLNISVTEQKEPVVGGVGFGLRTSVFGYFVRGDVAWGVEDGKVSKKPKYYLSFNLDF